MANTSKLYYKTCREMSGLAQEEACFLLHIADVTTFSRYENGDIPVSQELCADMVKVCRAPLLAYRQLRHANPDLVQYLPEVTKPVTDGDTALQMELADDDISQVRAAVKAIFRDGRVNEGETRELKTNAVALKGIADRLYSAASYLEEREANGGEAGEAQD
jgi:hypothetical protein